MDNEYPLFYYLCTVYMYFSNLVQTNLFFLLMYRKYAFSNYPKTVIFPLCYVLLKITLSVTVVHVLEYSTVGKAMCLYRKTIFSTTNRPISIKLGTNHPWSKEILNCTNKGPGPLQRGDNYKNAKMGRGHLKVFRTTQPE